MPKRVESNIPLNILYQPVSGLRPYANNPRTHSPKQIEQIAESIKVFGFTNPVLLDDENGIIAGHGRLEAARLLGLKELPTIRLSHMSDAQKRAYIIADNKLAENAGWDEGLLKIEFQYLDAIDLDFNLSVTGFKSPEIDIILNTKDQGSSDEVEEEPLSLPPVPVSRPGDVWVLGPHRIICGDSLIAETYEALLKGEQADLVFTDPPFNVPIHRHVCGLGKIQHEEFQMASGEMTPEQFTEFLEGIVKNLIRYSRNGSIHYLSMDWRHLQEILQAGRAYTELKNLCIWNKTNGGMGSLYRSKHELIFVYKNGRDPHINNVRLGEYGRNRTNVWDYAGINAFSSDRLEELSLHPTVKPVALVSDALLDCSNRGSLVLDCFGGSGTTLMAAERTGRQARLIEIDPKYVDVTVARYQKMFGNEAVHEATGLTFKQTEVQRRVS